MAQPAAKITVSAHGIGMSLLPLAEHQPKFTQTLHKNNNSIRRQAVSTVQINIGYKCDLACTHCHVEAGPKRTEMMTLATCNRILELIDSSAEVKTIDITGGAPELNENFRHLVAQSRTRDMHVIDRCNLTVLFEQGQEDTAEFLAANNVEIVASLPCYTLENVDKQRGKGVFQRSISALQKLNSLGYARKDSDLMLNLVYNPIGAYLPGPQEQLRDDYRKMLGENFGIEFNELFTITNMPIKRYAHYLRRTKQLEDYMQLLINNYNPLAAEHVMCINMVSVSYEGSLFDCDFNQMLDLPLARKRLTLWDISSFADVDRTIALDNHCYGCTSGAGSSCGGALL